MHRQYLNSTRQSTEHAVLSSGSLPPHSALSSFASNGTFDPFFLITKAVISNRTRANHNETGRQPTNIYLQPCWTTSTPNNYYAPSCPERTTQQVIDNSMSAGAKRRVDGTASKLSRKRCLIENTDEPNAVECLSRSTKTELVSLPCRDLAPSAP